MEDWGDSNICNWRAYQLSLYFQSAQGFITFFSYFIQICQIVISYQSLLLACHDFFFLRILTPKNVFLIFFLQKLIFSPINYLKKSEKIFHNFWVNFIMIVPLLVEKIKKFKKSKFSKNRNKVNFSHQCMANLYNILWFD